MTKRYEDWAVETAWATLAELDQSEWAAYMDADLTFLMGYASCDQFAEAALILRQVEGNGLAEKLAADDAEERFVPPVDLLCIADTPRAEPRDEACPPTGTRKTSGYVPRAIGARCCTPGEGATRGSGSTTPSATPTPTAAGITWANRRRARSGAITRER